jgi:hypothetical protein
LPNIEDINGVAAADIGAFSGVSASNIAKVDGVDLVTTTPLLDTYTGAQVAFSVRLLRTLYTGTIMRVRRASDNVEADVGFSAGELKLTSPISNTSNAQSYTDFADFVDHTGTPTDAFVRTWYDQSGNAFDAGQITATIQPQIYDATTGLIESGTTTVRASLQFETSATVPSANTGFDLSFASTLSQPFTASITTRDITTGTDEIAWMDNGNTAGLNGVSIASDGSPDTLQLFAGSLIGGTAQKDSDMLLFGVFNTTNSELFKNNSSIGSGNAGTRSLDGLTIGGLRPGVNSRFGIHGNVQEWILWDTAQGSTNRNGIHSDTNTYFGIY